MLRKDEYMCAKHCLELDEKEWQDYIMTKAKSMVRAKGKLNDLQYRTFLDPLQIVHTEGNTIELAFAPPKEEIDYEKMAGVSESHFKNGLEEALSQILNEECEINILPLEIKRESKN